MSQPPRSFSGLLTATVVCVVAVGGFAGLQALKNGGASGPPVQSVDYAAQVRAGRADGKLLTWAPDRLPTGWRATSAEYVTGTSPTWHLGVLTSRGKYVGVEESTDTIDQLVGHQVAQDANRGPDVTLAGQRWRSYTDSHGDYAVVRTLTRGGQLVESWLVIGSAPPSQVRQLAGSLTSAQGVAPPGASAG